ncbi:MAG: hypothetical protein Q3976_03325 [Corynebacterium sp.]|nr:hypothetical protein [Corynebacterium sp.]
MAEYQLRPTFQKKHWFWITFGVLFALLVPVGLDRLIPTTANARSVVTLAGETPSPVELTDDNGDPLECLQVDLGSFFDTYNCGTSTVYSGTVFDSENEDLTLQRMVRATTFEEAALSSRVARSGDIRILNMTPDYGIIGVSLATVIDDQYSTVFMIVTGKDISEMVALSYFGVSAMLNLQGDPGQAPQLPEELERGQNYSFDATGMNSTDLAHSPTDVWLTAATPAPHLQRGEESA